MNNDEEFNEETVKNRYLLPYLERLGFNPSELLFEENFTIQIGRTKVKTSKQTAMLDIKISRGNRTLFIVEAKHQGKKLTDSDRDQGISYASLVRPIAPFVILTNGDEFILYDTLTKKEVAEKRISPDSDYQVVLPADLVEEAISHFLGLSPENLRRFSRAQVDEELKVITGSKDNPNRKFIPELFVRRVGFDDAIRGLATGSSALFALIADSGSGKTCCLCDLAQRRAKNGQPVLFYRGINIKGPILHTVSEDFNWTFSERVSEIDLVRRLGRILPDDQLMIIVDGVDEWEYSNRRQDLLATAKRLAAEPRIKLIVSCKATAWRYFTEARGSETGIQEYLYREPDNAGGYALPAMSKIEFSEALEQYREFYDVGKPIQDIALKEASKNPFLMRVLFETSASIKAPYISLLSTDLFEAYLEQSTKRLKSPEAGLAILTSFAKELHLKGEERLTQSELARSLGPLYTHESINELIEFQIIERSAARPGFHLSFYFSPLRDYLVAFYAERWHEASGEAFADILEQLRDRPIHQDALTFFYRYAAPDKQRLIDSQARSRAREILRIYDTVISADLERIRNRFVPHASGPIGYVGMFRPRTDELGFSYFRELGEGDDEIFLLPSISDEGLYHSNLPHLHGGKGIAGSTAIHEREVLPWVLNTAIGHQLRNIIDDGLLDESQEPTLAKEAVIGLVSQTSRSWGGEPHPYDARRTPPNIPKRSSDLFPLDLATVRRWSNYRLLTEHFRKEQISENLESGKIPVERRESGHISYSGDLDWEDTKRVQRRVEESLDLSSTGIWILARKSVPVNYVHFYARLNRALDTLRKFEVQTIEDDLFPERKELPPRMNKAYSGVELKICTFLEEVMRQAFELYNRLVKWNFPTLYHHLPSVKWQPVTIVMSVRIEHRDREHFNCATIYFCNGSAPENRVIARPESEVCEDAIRDPSWRYEITVDEETFVRRETDEGDGCLGQRHLRLNRLFLSTNNYLGESSLGSLGPHIRPMLRVLIYDLLREEICVLFDHLCRKHGTSIELDDWNSFGGAPS